MCFADSESPHFISKLPTPYSPGVFLHYKRDPPSWTTLLDFIEDTVEREWVHQEL